MTDQVLPARSITIQQNSLVAPMIIGDPAIWNLAVLAGDKYPEIADLLVCIGDDESDGNPNAVGDHGKAKGVFQIWTSVHPITEACAKDLECSMDFTARMIKAGEGHLWTTYAKCLVKINKFQPQTLADQI